MFTPVRFRLPFPTDREAPQATRCDNPKKYSSRQLSAFGQFSAKVSPASGNVPRKDVPARQPPAAFPHRPRGSLSGPMRRPEKEQLQTAFGFWLILFEKSLQRPAAITRKSAASDSLRLWIYTEQKVSPAFGDILQPFASGGRL